MIESEYPGLPAVIGHCKMCPYAYFAELKT